MDERFGLHISLYFVFSLSVFLRQQFGCREVDRHDHFNIVVLSQQCFEKHLLARWIDDVTTAAIISTAQFVMGLSAFYQMVGVGKSNAMITSCAIVVL